MVLALLGTLLLVSVTGLLTALGPEFGGPLSGLFSRQGAHAVEEVHEASAWLLPWLVVLHVGGVLLSSVLERQNLVGGMVTGRKRPPTEPAAFAEPPLAARLAGFVMALVLGGLVVSALWRILPEAEAAEPQASLLAQYRQQAQAGAPAFQKEDPARGKALYFAEHERNGKRSSCATCHTQDARQEGRTPVGKRLDALAPSANPRSFTERKKADKWFDRNCKQVLGRTCSPGEKADFLAYLLTL
jgi:mono/diheme cytochrome c family protein